MANPITPDEVRRFRALVKSAAVVLLMLRLDRPMSAREMADILGLDEHTVAKHLRALAQLNLVARTGYHGGYMLLGGSQLILGGDDTTVNILQFAPTTTITDTDDHLMSESVEVVVDDPTVKKFQFEANPHKLSPTEQALQEAGIGEPKRSELAGLEHVTPEYVNAWEVTLKHDKGKRYTPGLLIYVLEQGDPAPPVNANGHHPDCECEDCRRIRACTCWYCKTYPCVCPPKAEDDEEDYEDDS